MDRKHYLSTEDCQGKGEWAKIIVGVGADNFINPYAPKSKCIWIKISSYIGFRINGGADLGYIMVNVGDILESDDKIRLFKSLAIGFLIFVSRSDNMYGNYDPELVSLDFGLIVNEVKNRKINK